MVVLRPAGPQEGLLELLTAPGPTMALDLLHALTQDMHLVLRDRRCGVFAGSAARA